MAIITNNLAGPSRFELENDGVKVRCLTAWLKPYKKWWWGVDSNHRTRREWIYSPPRLATSLPHHKQLLINNRYNIILYIVLNVKCFFQLF